MTRRDKLTEKNIAEQKRLHHNDADYEESKNIIADLNESEIIKKETLFGVKSILDQKNMS